MGRHSLMVAMRRRGQGSVILMLASVLMLAPVVVSMYEAGIDDMGAEALHALGEVQLLDEDESGSPLGQLRGELQHLDSSLVEADHMLHEKIKTVAPAEAPGGGKKASTGAKKGGKKDAKVPATPKTKAPAKAKAKATAKAPAKAKAKVKAKAAAKAPAKPKAKAEAVVKTKATSPAAKQKASKAEVP